MATVSAGMATAASHPVYVEVVTNAFCRVMTDVEFSISTPRIDLAKGCVGYLQTKLDEPNMIEFMDCLCTKLTAIVDECSSVTQSKSTQRERLWKSFYRFRSMELSTLWKELLLKLHVPQAYHSDLWLAQVTARLCFEFIIKSECSVLQPGSCEPKPLDADEHNALRYAAGYVLRSVKLKEERRKVPNPVVVSWIAQQKVSTDIDSTSNANTYQQFTKQWVEKVNRGGLYLISDSMYEVFHSMETVLRQYLGCLSSNHCMNVDDVVGYLHADDVQFYWSMLTADLDEEVSEHILRDIIRLWVTIRGFSYASTLVEQYKKARGALKKKKGLRADLKRKNSDRK